jgi:surface antigen
MAVGLLLAAAPFAPQAEAARGNARSEARPSSRIIRGAVHLTRGAAHLIGHRRATRGTHAGYGGGISCVPYARSITGMEIAGNGGNWWENAAGRYARGQRPQIGSILSFPSSGGMRLGHVAVVSRLVQPRMIEIDHANWGGPGIRRGTVMHNVRVIDVSDDNSWTRVRVQVGWDSSNFGREYPTDGFIHNRPASSYIAGADDMIRPVSYTTRSEIRSRHAGSRTRHAVAHPSRAGHQAGARNTHRAQGHAVSARTGHPVRLASARAR